MDMQMRAPFEMTEGLKNLLQIIGNLPPDSPHWNEAQNRFHFVDRLLRECLGWTSPAMDVEVSDGVGGRADYQLGKPAKAILEAKRESVLFPTLPTGSPATVRKIAPLLQASRDFKSAVEQVISYCALKGAPIAVVCNGPQLIIFQAFIPGHSALEGECFMFNGLDSYKDNFPLLWTLLSPEGIAENRANRDLSIHRHARIPLKASAAILEPTQFRYRSTLQENLRGLSSLLLEEIEDNPKMKSTFYRECYVSMEANTKHLLLSKRIIDTRYNRVGPDGISPARLASQSLFDKNADEVQSLKAQTGSRPVVVIGDVGVGKTSFFENLFLTLGANGNEAACYITIDLGIKANLSEELKEHILDAIPSALKARYGINIQHYNFATELYAEELEEFDETVEGQLKNIDQKAYETAKLGYLAELISKRDSHLHAALGYLAKAGKQIVLVLDNADQRSFEIQQDAFLIAQELAHTRNLLVFVALRPSTFYLSKASGALSGYQNRLLTISPPPADKVIEKRLAFAVQVAQGRDMGFLPGIELNFGNVVIFLNATLRAIRESEPIRRFLGNITGGNTRAVIELITSFCGSPNVDSNKIVSKESERGQYRIPLHEFSKHALLGDYAYFHAQSSQFGYNLFDVYSADPREHFLACLVVAYLRHSAGARNDDGFLAGSLILEEMRRLGYSDEQTRILLRRLAARRLIETPHAHYREIQVPDRTLPDEFHFRATSIGIYHVTFWAASFAFLDATSIDTPIFDVVVRDLIISKAASFDIRHRYEKASAFRTYLEGQWQAANVNVGYFDFSQLIGSNQGGFDSVKRFIQRAFHA